MDFFIILMENKTIRKANMQKITTFVIIFFVFFGSFIPKYLFPVEKDAITLLFFVRHAERGGAAVPEHE